MDLAPAVPYVADLEAELLAAYPQLTRRLALVLRDSVEAEDVAQSAFARAMEKRSRFGGGDARAWLYTIALRLAFNELRRKRQTARPNFTEEPAWAMETDPDLWLALDRLEVRHRAALLLHVIDGYSHEEIARMLGVRTGTVSSWLSRGRARLRQILGAPDDE